MLRILIIEDELPAQRMLQKMLGDLEREIEILDCIDSVKDAVEWFTSNSHPDLVLMDIQLSDGLSFEIMEQVRIESMIIFTTAFDEYAIQAFKVNSLDYLLKPIEKEELHKAFEKYELYSKRFIKNRNEQVDFSKFIASINQEKKEYRKRFLIQSNESFVRLEVSDIAFFYSMSRITFAHTFDNREFPLSQSLESLKEELDPAHFFKINRQMIINMKSIRRIQSHFKGKLKVETHPSWNQEIVVGKDKAASFKRWLDK